MFRRARSVNTFAVFHRGIGVIVRTLKGIFQLFGCRESKRLNTEKVRACTVARVWRRHVLNTTESVRKISVFVVKCRFFYPAMHFVCKELRARWSLWCAIDCNFIRGAEVLREKEGEEMLPERGRGI